MPRFTLYRGEAAPEQDATDEIRSAGAQVIAARPGLALIEATEEMAESLRTRLKDWRVTKESHAKQNPPRPKVGTR
jgi:hypothetical protein